MNAAMLEKDWQAQVLDLARTLHWDLAYHTHDSRRSQHGFPDLVLVRHRVVFLELKRAKGKLAPAQQQWLGGLLDAGAEAYVARPADLPELAVILAYRGSPFSARGLAVFAVAARLRDRTRSECVGGPGREQAAA